nr:hypothetical protein [Tanacetum cinerariifolium]
MQEVILFYNGLDVPTRQIMDSKGAIPSKIVADAKVAIQEMAEFSQKWHNGTSSRSRSTETSDGLAVIQDKDEGKSHAGTLVDIIVFIEKFSIMTGFTIIDDDDVTKGIVLGMPFCKKYLSCQMIMKKFTHGDECERIEDERE